MKEVHLEQGSPDWLAWRAGEAYTDIHGECHGGLDGTRITATAASVCGGHSPFATPHELWGEMLGYRKRQEADFAMLRGSRLEPKARSEYARIVGEEYEQLCIESSEHSWIAASLDGVDLLRTRGVEIKCPISEKTHEMALSGVVPIYYFDQIQWQLLASDNQLLEIDYYSYAPKFGKAAPITVTPNLKRQAELVEAAIRFRMAVMTRVPLSGSEFEQAAKAFLVLNRKLKSIEAQLDLAKERVKTLAAGQPVQGGGVMVTVSKSDGRPSWEKIAMSLVEKCNLSTDDLDELKNVHKGKPTTTISVKEAADADAIYESIMASQTSETSQATATPEQIEQPQPIW